MCDPVKMFFVLFQMGILINVETKKAQDNATHCC